MGQKQTTPIEYHMHFKNCLQSLKETPTKTDALSLYVSSNLAFFKLSSKSWKRLQRPESQVPITKLFKSSSKTSLNSTWLPPLQSTQELSYTTLNQYKVAWQYQ